MDMERTSRSFDRSRELPGLKRPRLTEEQPPPNPNGRPLTRRPAPSLPLVAARYRAAAAGSGGGDRGGDSERNESRYQPQAQPYQELVNQYKAALAELTFNSKPIITNLTIIAGENQHAAKAIAATVCTNILEVPSEQKLPSLYLLDSIVKNIGSDYIKYFAARLPEVFCKAYRQVDPTVRASLRHLYGTWKGVFPPQTLQIIDKELGFASAVNGASPKDETSKRDSQSQPPPRSIHVNPKYLERQRLQQSSRAKGIANDMNVPTTNSNEDVERMDRAAVIGAGSSWVDPPIKVHSIQRPHREAISEPIFEKKIGAGYGDFEYGSDVSRKSALAVGKATGRISEQGLEKPWHSTDVSVVDPISGQRNGFNIKHGFPNFSAAKSAGVDSQLRPTHSIATRSSGGMSTSWKNSEEEEFMWEMHSRISDQDAANLSNNSGRDHWTPDDSGKLEFESHLRKPQSGHELGSMFDREASSDSLSMEQKGQATFGHRLLSPWKESHSTDDMVFSRTSVSKGHSEGYSTTIGGLPKSANSSGRMSVQAPTASSVIVPSGFGISTNASLGSTGTVGQKSFQSIGAASPSGRLPMHQHLPIHSFSAQHPHQQLQSSADQDHSQSLSLPQRNHKAPQISGNLPSSAKQIGNLQKLRTEDLQAASPKMLSQQNRQRPVSQPQQQDSIKSQPSGQTKKPHLSPVSNFGTPSTSGSSASDNSDTLPAESSGQLSTSNLLAAVMKSGILSNITSVGLPKQSLQDNEQSNIQPPLPGRPMPPQSATSVPRGKSSISMSLSHDNVPAASNVSQRKQEHPSSAQTTNAVKMTPDPISNLLSSLVAKGLISASASASSKSETSSIVQPQLPSQCEKEKPSDNTPSSSPVPSPPVSSSIPQSAVGNEALNSEPESKTSVALPQSKTEEIENYIGLEFKPEVIRGLHPPVISALFDGITHQCSICGLRLKIKERLDRHLEWHQWKKQEPAGTDWMTRRWYANIENWVAGMAGSLVGVETSGFMDEPGRMTDKDEQMVPADEDQCACVLCGELFEDYYSQEKNKWMFKGAVHITFPSGDGDIGTSNGSASGLIVHLSCMSESLFDDLGLTSGIKMENVHDA